MKDIFMIAGEIQTILADLPDSEAWRLSEECPWDKPYGSQDMKNWYVEATTFLKNYRREHVLA